MEIRKVFNRNFLSRKRYSYGLLVSMGLLAFSLLLSMSYWHHDWGYLLSASPKEVFDNKEVWRLFTTSFVHGDLSHYLSNSLMLALMGYFVASYYSFWVFPILSFFLGGLLNYLVLLTHAPQVSLVGASGVVYLLWGFWLINYIFIQRHIGLNRRFMKTIAITLAILVPTSYQANVSYLAHFLGFVIGILSGGVYFLVKKKEIYQQEIYDYHYILDDEEDELPILIQ